jgi:hypothetical protein
MKPRPFGLRLIGSIGLCLSVAGIASAQRETDADRAAALVVRWKQVVYARFEDARAYIDEENSDAVNRILSQGAVQAIRDHVSGARLQKIDDVAGRLADAIIRAGKRQPGGSLILDAESREKGLDATCPVYPFCEW